MIASFFLLISLLLFSVSTYFCGRLRVCGRSLFTFSDLFWASAGGLLVSADDLAFIEGRRSLSLVFLPSLLLSRRVGLLIRVAVHFFDLSSLTLVKDTTRPPYPRNLRFPVYLYLLTNQGPEHIGTSLSGRKRHRKTGPDYGVLAAENAAETAADEAVCLVGRPSATLPNGSRNGSPNESPKGSLNDTT